MVTNVSEEHTASVFKVRHHKQVNHNLNLRSHENLKSPALQSSVAAKQETLIKPQRVSLGVTDRTTDRQTYDCSEATGLFKGYFDSWRTNAF